MVKVALIGAGSAVFAQRMITDILAIDGLDSGTFALVDLDTERLELAHEVAEQTIQSVGKPWTVQATTERRIVLPGCDYVINLSSVSSGFPLIFRTRPSPYRKTATRIRG